MVVLALLAELGRVLGTANTVHPPHVFLRLIGVDRHGAGLFGGRAVSF
jgi:hypothetical protein